MNILNIWVVLFQVMNIGFIVLTIFLIASIFKSNKKRSSQIDRIEKKIDILNEQVKKDK